MIIREIKDKPKKVLKDFDFFNNYTDTRKWLKRNYPNIIPQLDNVYTKWLNERKKL